MGKQPIPRIRVLLHGLVVRQVPLPPIAEAQLLFIMGVALYK